MNYRFLATFKRLLSYTKSTWTIDDYPLRYKKQGDGINDVPPWVVQIIHWWTMSGLGDTKEAAYQMLQTHFDAYRNANAILPRPGCTVPLQFADTSSIDEMEAIAVDFFDKILGYYCECFISDKSSLMDFGMDTEAVLQQINQAYDLDLKETGDGNIVRILKHIQAKQNGEL